MKKHAIIPIFIPHKGCPNDCVFCNQRKITARAADITATDIHNTVETYMSTLGAMDIDTIELSFFGGSFTGIPMEEQRQYLAIAKEYKDSGVIQKIHLSTRPDYINIEILDNLKAYGVDVIELGVQSFADPVLKASGRGHDAACVYEACKLIKSYGFTLGIQLMIGLPKDNLKYDIYSAKEAVSQAPDIARLYPTVVIRDTALWDMMECGQYIPMNEDDAVVRTAAMYKILTDAGINVIRVGLKSSDIISDEKNTAGTFHPAFRQLVEGFLAKESLEKQINKMYPNIKNFEPGFDHPCPTVVFVANTKCYNNMFGHGGKNRKYFENEYTRLNIKYMKDVDAGVSLADNEYLVLNLE